MKTLEQLAKEAGFDIADDGFVRAEGRILNARLSGFRALCMEEAAQICDDARCEPTPYQGEFEYRLGAKAYEVAQECAAAIRASIKD